jgi:hypothetical protein
MPERAFIILSNIKNKLIMSVLRFSDGEEFDASGQLRAEQRADGWYVLGNNRIIPVADEEDALLTIEKLTSLI